MSDMIEKLYNFVMFPPNAEMPRSEQYKALRMRNDARYDAFLAELRALKPGLTTDFIELIDGIADQFPHESAATFSLGFRMGARLMLAVLEKGEWDVNER